MKNIIDLYMDKVNKIKVLGKEKEYELAQRVKEGDAKARELMIWHNLRFVARVAHRFKGYIKYGHFSLIDLIQEGNLGLMIAVDKFDPDKGFRFTTYAAWWIRAAITNYVIRHYSVVKIGTTTLAKRMFFKLQDVHDIIAMTDEREKKNAIENLSIKMNISPQDLEGLFDRGYWPDESIDLQCSSDDDGKTFKDLISEVGNFEEEIVNTIFLREIKEELRRFCNENDEMIVAERRLLQDNPDAMAKVYKETNIKKGSIREIEVLFKDKLRNSETVKNFVKDL